MFNSEADSVQDTLANGCFFLVRSFTKFAPPVRFQFCHVHSPNLVFNNRPRELFLVVVLSRKERIYILYFLSGFVSKKTLRCWSFKKF